MLIGACHVAGSRESKSVKVARQLLWRWIVEGVFAEFNPHLTHGSQTERALRPGNHAVFRTIDVKLDMGWRRYAKSLDQVVKPKRKNRMFGD